ncbi:MAG: hypothetical protein LLP51_05505 [Halorhodospira halophila]|uniref:hypothetical protein n=1 Tax=Halorhodospira TaxID=85108 RepID=UPI0019133A69|nr:MULTISPECIES: hypothetical protein [Halorhodospira]MBK5942937.1 hypothetical protein [Halorhodospira halophila]MCC3750835.1 hypothetical protein [Halorhodospira halophila]MCG5537329.1 hypothetical protein [Halorhodospira sp. 9622]
MIELDAPDAIEQARKRSAELEKSLLCTCEEMRALVERFRRQWPTQPRPIYPGIHASGNERAPVIRWRLGGTRESRQSWLSFTSEQVQEHLEHQNVPQLTRLAWLSIDREAQRLNTRASVANAELRMLKRFAEHMAQLDALERNWSSQ